MAPRGRRALPQPARGVPGAGRPRREASPARGVPVNHNGYGEANFNQGMQFRSKREGICAKTRAMFSPKTLPVRNKTPFLVRPLDGNEGLEPRMLLDDRLDDEPQEPEARNRAEASDRPEALTRLEGLRSREDVRASTDLLIKGLMDRLPEPGSNWSCADRARWLQTAASIFGLIYEPCEGEQRQIAIALDDPVAKS